MGTHPIFESDLDCLTESRMAAISSWHRVLRYGALTFGVVHGGYAFQQLKEIRAAERKEEIEVAKAYIAKTHMDAAAMSIEQQKDSYLFGTKLPEAPAMGPYNPADDLLLTLDGPYKLHPAIQKLWAENKGKARFGNHIGGARKEAHAGPKAYVGMLAAPVEGRGRSSFDNQILTLNALLEVNKKLGIDTSNPENIIFPTIARDDNNVVRVAGGDEAPKCSWTATL